MASYNSVIDQNTQLAYQSNKTNYEEEIPKWSCLRDKIKNNSALNKFNTSMNDAVAILNKINGYMETAQDVLELAQSITKAFSEIESIIMSSAWALLNFLIEQIDMVLKDIESTGIYFLDCTYRYFNKGTQEKIEDGLIKGDWFYGSSTENLGYSASEEDYADEGALLQALGLYQTNTYYEFIGDIIACFNNPNDVPRMNPDSFDYTMSNVIKCGRPLFSDNCEMKGYLLVFAIKDIKPAIRTAMNLYEFFMHLGGNKGTSSKGGDSSSIIDELLKAVDVDGISKAWDKLNFKRPEKQPPIPETHFLGVNLYSLLPDFFNGMDNLVKFIRSLINSDPLKDAGIMKALERQLQRAINFIEKIKNIINQINSIILAIETLLSFSDCFWLKIDTQHGVNGFIDQLSNATGFFDTSKFKNSLLSIGIPKEYVEEFLGLTSSQIITKIEEFINNYELLVAEQKEIEEESRTSFTEKYTLYSTVLSMLTNQATDYINALNNSEYQSLLNNIDNIITNYDNAYSNLESSLSTFTSNNYDWLLSTYESQILELEHEIDYTSDYDDVNIDIRTWKDAISTYTSTRNDLVQQLAIYTEAEIQSMIDEIQLNIDSIDTNISLLNNEINTLIDSNNKEITNLNNKIAFIKLKNELIEARFALNDYTFNYQSHIDSINAYVELLDIDITTIKNDISSSDSQYNDDKNIIVENINNAEEELNTKETTKISKQIELNWADERIVYYTSTPPTNSAEQAEYDYALNIHNTYPDEISALSNDIDSLEANIAQWTIDLENLLNNYTEYSDEWNNELEVKLAEKKICTIFKEYIDYKIQMFKNRYEKTQNLSVLNSTIDSLCNSLNIEHLTYRQEFASNAYYAECENDLKRYGYSPDERELLDDGLDYSAALLLDSSANITELRKSNTLKPFNSVNTLYYNKNNEAEIKYQKASEELENLNNKLKALQKIYDDKDKLSIIDSLFDEWGPNDKMYYGGALMCYGLPNFSEYEVFDKNDLKTIFEAQYNSAKNQIYENQNVADSKEFIEKSKEGYANIKKILKKVGI